MIVKQIEAAGFTIDDVVERGPYAQKWSLEAEGHTFSSGSPIYRGAGFA